VSRRRRGGEGKGEGSLRKSGDTEFNLIDTKLDESNAETLRPSKPISARKTKAVTIGANMQI